MSEEQSKLVHELRNHLSALAMLISLLERANISSTSRERLSETAARLRDALSNKSIDNRALCGISQDMTQLTALLDEIEIDGLAAKLKDLLSGADERIAQATKACEDLLRILKSID